MSHRISKNHWLIFVSLLSVVVSITAYGHTVSPHDSDRAKLLPSDPANAELERASSNELTDSLLGTSESDPIEDGLRAGSQLDDPSRMLAAKKKKSKAQKKKKSRSPTKKAKKTKDKSTPVKTKKKK